MGSEKYRHYIINLLIDMGYCYEVKRIYGIEQIKNEYTSLFLPNYNPSICNSFKGDSFLINIGLFKMYKHDKLTLRDMEKELFLVNDKLITMSKSSIQRLSVKIKKFNEQEYFEEKIKILSMGIVGYNRDRLEQEIKKTEQAINESNFYLEISRGVVSTIGKTYYSFNFETETFSKLLKRERFLKGWDTFVLGKFENDKQKGFIIRILRNLINKSFKIGYITKTQEEFNISGGIWIHNKALRLYIEEFKKNYNLDELGLTNFDKKFIKK
ncbi:MAG: hypothetical protein ACRCZO_06605 [Cetobacterium sp.]